MELMIPWILSYILDYVVPQKNTRLVLFWGLLMVLSAIAALVGNILANRISASVARDTTRTLRHDLFKKISYLSSAQIDYFSIPSLEARLTTDSYNINQVIGMMQRLGIRAPILLIGGIAITMTLEPVLTWTMISVLPFIALVVWLVSRKGIPMYTDLQRGVDIMVRTVRENISGIRVIKALSKTEQEKEHFSQVNRDVVRRETKASVTMGITNPMMNLFLNVGLTLVIVVGAFRINAGKTQPGTIIAFLSYFTIILNAMLSVTRIFVMYSRASASAGRIYEVLNAPEDLTIKEEPAVEEEEHIVFDDVCFSYKGKTDNVSHISFKLKKGETLGIIGATGAGKSTIINLLILFFLLKKFLFGRVNAVLEQRAALVKGEISSAEENNRQAEALKAQYEGKLTDARHEAAKIVADAQNRAQRVYEGKMAEAETDAKRLRSEAEAQIAEQRDAMLRGARNEVASLALLAAAKVAQRSMDGDDDKAFVDTFLSEVGEQA